ncbi:MAG: hypothetical protein IT462_05980 [Planctomycetes bacterium]|nr:hypothetical protein [Planctomycetota bacterium]
MPVNNSSTDAGYRLQQIRFSGAKTGEMMLDRIAGLFGLGKQVIEFVPTVKKINEETKLTGLQAKEAEHRLAKADDNEAWRRAETIALALIPTATETLRDFAKELATLQMIVTGWRFNLLARSLEPQKLAEAEKSLNETYGRVLEKMTMAVFYLGEGFLLGFEDYISTLGSVFRETKAKDATIQSTTPAMNRLSDTFVDLRYGLRLRLDPIETLREASKLSSLDTREEMDKKVNEARQRRQQMSANPGGQ